MPDNGKKGKKDTRAGQPSPGVPPSGPPPPPQSSGSGVPAAPQDGRDNGNTAKRFKNLIGLTDYHSVDFLKANPPKPFNATAVPSLPIHPLDPSNFYAGKKDKDAVADSLFHETEGEYHRSLIQAAFLETIRDKKRPPTFKEIADRTGLEKGTVAKHLKNLRLKDSKNPFKILTPLVLLNLTNKALDPEATDATIKLWLQVVAGYVEKSEVDVSERIDFRQTLTAVLNVKDDADRSRRLSQVLNANNRPNQP